MSKVKHALLAGALMLSFFNLSLAETAQVQACTNTQTEDCVVRQFKDSEEAMLIRGKAVYSTYCVLCHGETGEGNGRAAKIHNPKPANFTVATLPLEYFRLIVPMGGEVLGRSKAMPPWSEQLTDEQIKDVTFYAYSFRYRKNEQNK